MPLIQFKCIDCQTVDDRISAHFETTALCHECDGLMLRTDEDLFAPLFYEAEREEQAWDRFRLGLAEGRRELEADQ